MSLVEVEYLAFTYSIAVVVFYSCFKILRHFIAFKVLSDLVFFLSTTLVILASLLTFSLVVEPLAGPEMEKFVWVSLYLVWWILMYFSARTLLILLTNRKGADNKKLVYSKIFRDILQLFLLILTFAAIIKFVFEKDVTSIFTASGVFAIVLGYSAQGTLGDIISGLALNAAGQFKAGDWLAVNDGKDTKGKVLDITWRSVNLLTSQGSYLSIPNSTIAKLPVLNTSEPGSKKNFSLKICLRVEIPPAIAIAIIESAARRAGRVLSDPGPKASFERFSASKLEPVNFYGLSYSVNSRSNSGVDSEILSGIWYQCRRKGIQGLVEPIPPVAMPEKDKLRDFLAGLDLFGVLTPDELNLLVDSALCQPYGPQEKILVQGQSNTSLFVIYSGRVEVFIHGGAGEEVRVAELTTGQYVGEMSLLTGALCGATVAITEESIFIEITNANIAALFKKNPTLMEKMSEVSIARTLANKDTVASTTPTKKEQDDLLHRLVARVRSFFGG